MVRSLPLILTAALVVACRFDSSGSGPGGEDGGECAGPQDCPPGSDCVNEGCVPACEPGDCDCDDSHPDCTTACPGGEVDDFCATFGCEDRVPTCATDCASDGDGDGVPDCVERYCGSDPDDPEETCVVVTSPAELDDAIAAANASDRRSFLLLDSFTVTASPEKFTSDQGVEVRGFVGAAVTVDATNNVTLFEVDGDNHLFADLRVVNHRNLQSAFDLKGDDHTIRNVTIDGYKRRGIYLRPNGSGSRLLDNVIRGGADPVGNERGGIVVQDHRMVVVAGNLVVQSNHDGVQIRKAEDVFFDHNTVAHHGGDAVRFRGDSSSNLCMRNNLVTGNTGVALKFDEEVSFDTGPSCVDPLAAGPAYGNARFENDGTCGGSRCPACSCLPDGTFWEFTVDPLFAATDLGLPGFYCPAAEALIDGAHDLGYDRVDHPEDRFHGAAPDVGAIETGLPGCP